MALDLRLREQIRDASRTLCWVYEERSNFDKALQYHKQYIVYRDSIENMQAINKMADQRLDFELSLIQTKLNLARLESKQKILFPMGNRSICVIATCHSHHRLQ